MFHRLARAWLFATLVLGITGTRAQQGPDATQRAAPGGAASLSSFNPALSLILSGTYADLSRDPDDYRIRGFAAGGDVGPGPRGFNLGESELGFFANIDPYFYGAANISITPENEAVVEEAFVQTTALGSGFTVKFGRFFSGIGYLNEQHAHTWDFVDSPLAYQAFLGTQLNDDGVQVRWLAPTPLFLEFGAELGRGSNFPGSERNKNGSGRGAIFTHAGGDWGDSSSWRAGLSYMQTSPRDRTDATTNLAGNAVTNAFSGKSRLWVADFVWKWAPNGNPTRQNFKLQTEYFQRRERGALTYDLTGVAATDAYSSRQSGAYVQAVYQFLPRWRTGVRYDRLDSGTVDLATNAIFLDSTNTRPSRVTWMTDYNSSEFSRIRLQLARDRARGEGKADNQVFVQYQMSLGAHGAHMF
ncbi:MAG TPA: TonB-dependent receptor [Burkholderiaceae bacterium]|nr:TonB-dependent receptor [Burkholderiaceae bacterium]